ncbi:MAG: NADH:ubiquinone reductase (Na(+)-transporting) subunit D [Spirochaetes bacterium]|nr:NADH:ubiquinone reductase (Na(+)-transporting) subunit D [Spirochaetota bacterium]
MSDNAVSLPSAPGNIKPDRKKYRETFFGGIYTTNPVTVQVLGICIFLAVTIRVQNSIVMGLALIVVLTGTNLFVSMLRAYIPRRIRMIVEVAIIATFVIILDQLLRAFYWDMSKQLGPYVALIITNCIVMGRAEAFAIQNPPLISMVDGAANGIGYLWILVAVALVRELIGSGTILGFTILSTSWYTKNILFLLAPGAFITGGLLIWVINAINLSLKKEKAK